MFDSQKVVSLQMRNISLHSSWTCHIKLSITYQPVSHRRGPIIILRNIIYKDFNVPQKFCFWRLRHVKDLSSFVIDSHPSINLYQSYINFVKITSYNDTYDTSFNLIGLKYSIHHIFHTELQKSYITTYCHTSLMLHWGEAMKKMMFTIVS